MSRAAIFDDAQTACGNLVGHPVVEQDHAIGNIFFQPVTGQSAVAAFGGDDGGYAPVFEPAKQAAQFRPQDALILQSGKQIFDGVENHALRANGVDGGAQPDEEAFQIVVAGFVNLAALDADEINDQLLFVRQFIQVETERANILRELGAGLLECHENAGFVVFRGSANQELHGQQSLARAGAAADERGTAARETASGDLIQALDAGRRFGQTTIFFCHLSDSLHRSHLHLEHFFLQSVNLGGKRIWCRSTPYSTTQRSRPIYRFYCRQSASHPALPGIS